MPRRPQFSGWVNWLRANAIRLALSRGVRVQGVPAVGAVLDLSRREDVPAVMARLRDVEPRP